MYTIGLEAKDAPNKRARNLRSKHSGQGTLLYLKKYRGGGRHTHKNGSGEVRIRRPLRLYAKAYTLQ